MKIPPTVEYYTGLLPKVIHRLELLPKLFIFLLLILNLNVNGLLYPPYNAQDTIFTFK